MAVIKSVRSKYTLAGTSSAGYFNGDGNDRIYGLNSDDVFDITGNWSSVRSGSDIVLTVGNGKISLMGAEAISDQLKVFHGKKAVKAKSKITGYNQDDLIENGSFNSNGFNSVTINSAAGNDTIYNYGGRSLSVDAGAGNDYIYNSVGSSAKINAGAGNDTIVSKDYNYHVSINGGTGNDTISLKSDSYGTVINYTNGDGNDTIYGFGSDDVLN